MARKKNYPRRATKALDEPKTQSDRIRSETAALDVQSRLMAVSNSPLIPLHREAAESYRRAVLELEKLRRAGSDHDRYLTFLNNVVTPAREKCYQVFQEWLKMRARR